MDSVISFMCILGIICAFITIFFNTNLIITIVMKKSKRVDEMTLFYYRFVLDVFYGVILLSYVIFVLLSILYPKFMLTYRSLIVYLALPWSNLGACRSLIELAIGIERVSIVFFPLKYRKIRERIPNWLILSVSLAFGLSEWLVLFGFCHYDMVFAASCRVFGCAIDKCFYNFWTGHKAVIFSSIALLSAVLSVKLFVWNNFRNPTKDQKLSRTNRLALISTVTVIIFDFSPSFCGNIWPTFPVFNFDVVGPYNPVMKVVGCAIESVIVTTVLWPKSTITVVTGGGGRAKTSKRSSKEVKLSAM